MADIQIPTIEVVEPSPTSFAVGVVAGGVVKNLKSGPSFDQLASEDGAGYVVMADGRTVEERIAAIPAEVDAAGTAETKVVTHNADAAAHPALSAFITAEADRAQDVADTAAALQNYFPTPAIALSNGVLSIGSLVAGSGGTNGTFDIGFSGGSGTGAAGKFVVSGGVITQILLTTKGANYTSAPTLSFSASAGLTGASAIAIIGTNAPVNTRFSGPSLVAGEAAIIYDNVAGVAVERSRVANSDAVLKPDWTGKKNGWPDTYFRHSQVGVDYLGRHRWRGHTGGNNYTGCSIASSSLTPFDGRVFRKTGPGNQAGPLVWLDEIGAVPGDTITIVSQIAGAVGKDAYMLGDFYTAANAANGAAIAGGTWSAVRDSGATGLIMSASPQRLHASVTVPAAAEAVNIRFYSISAGASEVLDVIGLWVVKGASAPFWATLEDETWQTLMIQQQEATIASQAILLGAADTKIAQLESVAVPSGLRDFKVALTNPFCQFLGVVFPGDSITWGKTASGIATDAPRASSLTDARNNGSSATWFNLLHKYLGRQYYDDAIAVESAWPGTPSGVAIFEYNNSVDEHPALEPFTYSNTNVVSPGAWSQVTNANAKLGTYLMASVVSGTDNLRLKFPPFTGYEFDLVFAAQSNGAKYDLIVDGVTLGRHSTQTGDTGLPVSFGNVRTHTLGGFKRNAAIELYVVPGDGARYNLRLEAVTVKRRLRITNQGIIGTYAGHYFTSGAAAACLQEGDMFAFAQLGTNDRAAPVNAGVPQGASSFKYNMGLLCDLWEAASVKPIIMCANAVLDDGAAGKKFTMATARNTLRQFAAERRYDFIDNFSPTQSLIAAGDTTFLADLLHPSDIGHAIEFGAISDRIEKA